MRRTGLIGVVFVSVLAALAGPAFAAEPKIDYRVPPSYPDDAAAAKIEGEVEASVTLTAGGRVKAVTISRPSAEPIVVATLGVVRRRVVRRRMVVRLVVERRVVDRLVVERPAPLRDVVLLLDRPRVVLRVALIGIAPNSGGAAIPHRRTSPDGTAWQIVGRFRPRR